MCTDQKSTPEAILDYYKIFLRYEKIRIEVIDTTDFLNKVVLTEAWDMLCQQVSVKEIKEALWSIKDDKSPGPDGYNSQGKLLINPSKVL